MEKTLYGMKETENIFGKVIKSSEFYKAKCPICKHNMDYEESPICIRFACVNLDCQQGYLRWTPNYRKTFFGHIQR